MADTGIVRNRAKVEAAIANARAALELPDGLAGCSGRSRPTRRPGRGRVTFADVPPTSPESTAMAKDLQAGAGSGSSARPRRTR